MLDLMRRRPLELSAFDEWDTVFDDLFRSFSPGVLLSSGIHTPSADIYSEDDRNMVVELEVPGFDREEITISVKGGVLDIRGERAAVEGKDTRSYVTRGTATSFVRRIALPEGADSEHISAELDKGLLKVTVPVEQANARRVEIATPKRTQLAGAAASK